MTRLRDLSDPSALWPEPLDALFLSPHPDDVELFCGGTVASLAARGHRIGIADLTRGELGSNGTVEERRRESLEAAAILGVALPRPVLGLPDGGLADGDPAQLQALVALLRRARPRLVFAPLDRDRHPDHVAAGLLARRAVFFAGVRRFAAAGEAQAPVALVHYIGHALARPTFVVDVSDAMAKRRQALAAYASQFVRDDNRTPTRINHPRFLPAREARMMAWAEAIGVAYAEGFVLEETPSVDDPVRWLGSWRTDHA